MNSSQRPRLRVEDYTIGWVCALPIECAAATTMLDEQHAPLLNQDLADTNSYTLGRIEGHNIVIACLPSNQVGTTPAATVAVHLTRTFPNVCHRFMVGIGGGVPGPSADIRLGDVVISQPSHNYPGGVVQYDHGKTLANGKFEHTGFLSGPPQSLLSALNVFKSNRLRGQRGMESQLQAFKGIEEFGLQNPERRGRDLLFKPNVRHWPPDSRDCNACTGQNEEHWTVKRDQRQNHRSLKVHFGTIASGNQVIRDAITRDNLSSKFGGILCFEMEAAGLMNNFQSLVIRGIADYADSHKNKNWQPYAAATAAACAKELILLLPPPAPLLLDPSSTMTLHVMRSHTGELTLRTWTQQGAEISNQPQWHVPFARNKGFVGRVTEIEMIGKRLFSSQTEQMGQRIALKGLGGIGKTQIALELAYRMKELFRDCSVFWIPLISSDAFQAAYKDISKKLGLLKGAQSNSSSSSIAECLREHLSKEDSGRWFMILDNADDYELCVGAGSSKAIPEGSDTTESLFDYIPSSPQGTVLVTTRDRKTAMHLVQENIIDIDKMDNADAASLFRGLLINKDDLDANTIDPLLEWLSGLPLAITQAASFINANDCSVKDYMALLNGNNEKTRMELFSDEFGAEGRYKDSKNPVITTWMVSFERIRQRHPLAASFLAFIACISPNRIPTSVLPGINTKRVESTKAIGTLSSYSFITRLPNDPRLPEERFFNIHPLVHMATRSWLQKLSHPGLSSALEKWTQSALRRLAHEARPFSFPKEDFSNRYQWRSYLPHAIYVLDSIQTNDCKYSADLHHKVAHCFKNDGYLNCALRHYKRSLNWRRNDLGASHPDTLSIMVYTAFAYKSLGRWGEGEDLLQESYSTSKEVLGARHPTTLSAICGLVHLYCGQRRYAEAQVLATRVLETKEQLGECHPVVLTLMSNLAVTLDKQGRWEEAAKLNEEVLKKFKVVFGESHPTTLKGMMNRVSDLERKGSWKEAQVLQSELVERRKEVLGVTHPDTLSSMVRLASIFVHQGREDEARELEEQVLKLRTKALGESHPITIESMRSVGWAYLKCAGKEAEGKKLLRTWLRKKTELLGESEDFLVSAKELLEFQIYSLEKRWDEAEDIMAERLAREIQLLGDSHPDTLTTMGYLVTTYSKREWWTVAAELQLQVVEKRRECLGEADEETLESMNELAAIYSKQGRSDEACDLEKEVFSQRRELLGERHRDTLTSMERLARTHCKLNRAVEGLEMLYDCYQLSVQAEGAEHPDTKRRKRLLDKLSRFSG